MSSDRVAEIREAYALWHNDNISLNDDPRSAWQKLDLLIDAARDYADLLENCDHDWYRSVSAPPDTCLKCGAEEDRG